MTWKTFAKMSPLLWLAACLALEGCNTVKPKTVGSAQAAFDAVADGTGNHQNGGVLGWTDAGDLVITEGGRALYNSVINHWGQKQNPPVMVDFALTPFTNAVVPALWISNTKQSPPFPRTVPLWLMDPAGQDLWGQMTVMANNPIPK